MFGARLHEEEVILDPALNPFTPQPLLVVSPDGQQVAVARQYKDSMDSPTAGQTGANNAEKPASIPHVSPSAPWQDHLLCHLNSSWVWA